MPSFTARIDKNGNLGVSTYIIGKTITLTPSEVKKINAASTAKPTDMTENTDLLSDMEDNLDDKSDLPF